MKILFWNVDRLSTSDSKARSRCERILKVLVEREADIIGLSEISGHGVDRLKAFARDYGYRALIRKTTGKERGTALLVAQSVNVGEATPWAGLDSEVSTAVVSRSGVQPFTVASVYNSCSGVPAVLSDAQRFAVRHSAGRILAGGDFNMARALDHSTGTRWKGFGSSSIDAIQAKLGWIDVLPGTEGTEVPTVAGNNGFKGMPRQLDRVFVGGDKGFCASARVEVIQVTDLEAEIVAAPPSSRLSDHALLEVHVD